MLTKKMPKAKLEEKLKKYKRPQNCDFLLCPKVNSEVWLKLKKHVKAIDLKWQDIHELQLKGMIPLVRLVQKLLEAGKTKQPVDTQSASELAVDALNILANTSVETAAKRRAAIRPHLNQTYRQLCSDSTPVTTQLLGDDLQQQVKTLSETSKLTKDITQPKRRQDYQGHSSGYGGANSYNSYNSYNKNQSLGFGRQRPNYNKQQNDYGQFGHKHHYQKPAHNSYNNQQQQQSQSDKRPFLGKKGKKPFYKK
jgi:hypothetical protein